MTNATTSTRTVVEHRFEVPCEEPWGGTWDDFGVALAWAKTKAQALGINTSTADWSRLHVEDDSLVIVLTETVTGTDQSARKTPDDNDIRPVHDHGPEDGPGLTCGERRLPDGSLRGACLPD